MTEKNHTNHFRFALFQEDILLGEKMFDADVFNPFTRYSIDIRDILPQAITRFQKLLSRKRYNTLAEVGEQTYYDLFNHVRKIIETSPDKYRNDLKYTPKSIKQQIDDKIIKGVECKIGLYINDNPIVERVFYVDGFNYVARYSTDVIENVIEVADLIFHRIKRVDMKNMWDDYDLINKRGLTINQIRELHPSKRAYLLRSI